jgi:protein-S-isoprenylcysteine O-methyltransferase Ste14
VTPSNGEARSQRTRYHRLAEAAVQFVASPWVFVVLAVVIAGDIAVFHSASSMNAVVELGAFAIVVLIHARARATERAMNQKLDALAEGMAVLLKEHDQADRGRRLEDAAGAEHEL